MASVMGIRGGLMEPKSETVDFILVFVCFFEGSRAAGGFQENKRLGEKWGPTGQSGAFRCRKSEFVIQNALCLYWD